MKEIELTQGKVALVDDSDFEWLSQWNWHARTDCKTPYAQRFTRVPRKHHIKMHRFIISAPIGMEVDHIDGNGLNNQRANLRLATRAQNAANRGKNIGNSTGYKGVFRYHAGQLRWSAQIGNSRGKTIYLGKFSTPEEAARAYDAAARERFGEFAKLNFPDEFRV